jgi:toxin ParE1/3/4
VDVKNLWIYIAERNYPAADALLEKIDSTLKLLAQNPQMGETVDHLHPGLRRFTLGNYLLLFEPIEDGVRLMRVVHAARRLDELFD